MADLAELGFKADTRQLDSATQSLRNVERQGSRTDGAVITLTGSFKKSDAAAKALSLTAVGLTGALGAMAASSADANLELEAQARQAGVAVDEYQRLAFAAASAGVQQEKFGDITKDAQDKIGDFISTGGGELADFFENIAPKVGVTAEEFVGLSGPAVLGRFVDTLERANVNQADSIFYMESLADEASRLKPIFEDGGAAIDQAAAKMASLGVQINNTDVRRVADLASSFGLLQAAAGNAATEITAAFADDIEAAIENVIIGINTLSGAVAENGDEIKATAVFLGSTVAAYAAIRTGMIAYAAATRGAAVAQLALNVAMRANPAVLLATAIGAVGVAVYSMSQRTKQAGEELQRVTEKAEAYRDAVETIGTAERAARVSMLQGEIDRLSSMSEVNAMIAKRAELYQLLENVSGTSAEAGVQAAIDQLNASIAKTGEKSEETKSKLADLRAELARLKSQNDQSAESQKTLAATEQESSNVGSDLIQQYSNRLALLSLNNQQQAMHNALLKGATVEQAQIIANIQTEIDLLQAKGQAEEHAAGIVEQARMLGMDAMQQEQDRHAQLMQNLKTDRDSDLLSHQKYLAAKTAAEEINAKKVADIQAQQNQMRVQALTQAAGITANLFGQMANMAKEGGRESFQQYKNFASAQAGISAALAVANVLASPIMTYSPPLAIGLAASVGAMGIAQIAQIQGQEYQGSYLGGGYTGTGSRTGGIDGNGGFPAILHPNETVIDHEKGQSMGGQTIEVNNVFQISGNGQNVQQEIMRAMPMITQATTDAVQQAAGRGGSMSRAVGRR